MPHRDTPQPHDTGAQDWLAAIRARAESATPGPWEMELAVTHEGLAHYSLRTHDPLPAHPWSPRYIAWLTGSQPMLQSDQPRRRRCETCGVVSYPWRQLQLGVDLREDDETTADAAFLAHAREDVPALVAEVERLRAENEQMREIVRVVAEGDNSDQSICYQLCSYTLDWTGSGDDELQVMTHNAPCVVKLARKRLAESEGRNPMPDDLETLSNTYTWEVTSKSNSGLGGVKLVAHLGHGAHLVRTGLDGGETPLLAQLSEPTLESLAQALSYWLTWRDERQTAQQKALVNDQP